MGMRKVEITYSPYAGSPPPNSVPQRRSGIWGGQGRARGRYFQNNYSCEHTPLPS
jgi:hypothetical protein